MDSVQLLALRSFVSERLTAAAEEIFGAIERTICEYQEEVSRSLIYQCTQKEDITSHRTEPKQHAVSDCKDEEGSTVQQEYQAPLEIKEEQPEPTLTRQEGEEHSLHLPEETDLPEFIFTHPTTTKSSLEATGSSQALTCSVTNSFRAPQPISVKQMKMELDAQDDYSTWEMPSSCQYFSSEGRVTVATASDHFPRESGWPQPCLRAQTSCVVSNTSHLSHHSLQDGPCNMNVTGKERAARYRARLNCNPSAKEQYLAKRRASYRVRKASGLVDRKSIKDMNNEAQDRLRRMWRIAKQKQREKMSVVPGSSLSYREDVSSS